MSTRLSGPQPFEKNYIVKAEDGNVHEECTMAVVKEGNVVGHMPCSSSHVSWFFLKRGGRILCRVSVP